MKKLIISTILCVGCTIMCSGFVAAASFVAFTITAAVYGWQQSKTENK